MVLPISQTIRTKNRIEAEEIIRSMTRSVYLGDHRSICIVLGGYKMLVDTRDLGFAPHMMFEGYWEYWLTRYMVSRIKPGDVVADIGANLGYYTLLMAELVGPEGHVHAFEPNPAINELLRLTINLNGFGSRVTVHDGALVAPDGPKEVSFFIPTNDAKNAAIVPEGFSSPKGEVIKVATHTLDELRLPKLDFMKIDVEGAELGILAGSRETRQSCNPKLVCEINFGRRYSYDDVLAHLGIEGGLMHVDYESVARPLSREMTTRERINQDWLACIE